MLKFKVSANFAVTGKLDRNGNFDLITAAKYWQISEWSIKDLAQHIQKGHPWMPGLLDGERRLQENVQAAYVLTADIDDGWTIEQALCHPFVSKYCALGITSASHTKDHHKFRLVFVLPEAVEGHQSIRSCNETLIDYLEVSDKSCKDASRFYFGSENAGIFLEQDVVLPVNWLEQMSQAIVSRDVGEYRLPALTNLQKSGGEDLRDLIQRQIYPRLSLRDAFDWTGHNWNEEKRTGKLKGCCPWHESQSGTSFYAQIVDGVPLWRCPACDIGGDPIAYRDRLSGGNGNPKGKAFVGIVQQLASQVGVELPRREVADPGKDEKPKTPVGNSADSPSLKERAATLREELQAYITERDSLSRTLMRSDICARYRISKQDLIEQVMLIEQENAPAKKNRFKASELFTEQNDPIRYLFNRYLPIGEQILIASQAGVGKTNVITDAIYSALTGEEFLGEGVAAPCRVLFISSDESEGTTKRRLRSRGVDSVCADNLNVWTEFDITKLEELEQTLDEWRPQLVCIDSITTICSNVGLSEKDPEFAVHLYKLKNLWSRYQCSAILTHHTNKDPLAKGLGKVSGSARIPAAFWGVFLLERPDANPENPFRWLEMVKGREVQEFKVKIQTRPRGEWLGGCFSVIEDEDKSDARAKRNGILQYLQQKAVPLEFEEIAYAFPFPKGSLYRYLDRLEDDRLIAKRKSQTNYKKWVYIANPPTPPYKNSKSDNENAIKHTGQEISSFSSHSQGLIENGNENEGLGVEASFSVSVSEVRMRGENDENSCVERSSGCHSQVGQESIGGVGVPHFSVGSEVKVSDPNHRFFGRVGSVTECVGTNGSTQYRVSGDTFLDWFLGGQIEGVSTVAVAASQPEKEWAEPTRDATPKRKQRGGSILPPASAVLSQQRVNTPPEEIKGIKPGDRVAVDYSTYDERDRKDFARDGVPEGATGLVAAIERSSFGNWGFRVSLDQEFDGEPDMWFGENQVRKI